MIDRTDIDGQFPPVWVLIIAGSLLVAATGFPPFLELVGRIAGPVALVLLYRVVPRLAIGTAAAGALLLLLLTRDVALAAMTAFPVAASSILLARGMMIGLRPLLVIGEAALPFLIVAIAVFAQPLQGEERDAEIEKIVEGSLALNAELGQDPQAIAAMEGMMRRVVEAAVVVAPAALFLHFLALILVVYSISVKALGRFGGDAIPIPSFSEWRSPFSFVWVFAAGLVAVLIGSGAWFDAGLNLVFIIGSIYLVQGLSILTWQFRARRIAIVWQAVFYLVSVFVVFPFFVLATVSTGLFDTWFDFRRLDHRPESEEE